MNYQAVIFDLDGTLLDTLGDLAAAGNYALEQGGFPTHPKRDFRYFVGDGRRNMVLRMLPPEAAQDEATVKRTEAFFDEFYHAHMLDTTAPFPGVVPLLAALRQAGLKLGVVSNKPDEFVQGIVAQYFLGMFDVVCGQQGGVLKPDPAGVNRILKQLGLRPQQALYVGDSGVDMQTAKNAGCPSCGVTWGFREKTELVENGAGHLADTAPQVLALAQPGQKGRRIFSLAVVAVMAVCLVGVIYSLVRGNLAGVSAGLIFPVILGFAATGILKK